MLFQCTNNSRPLGPEWESSGTRVTQLNTFSLELTLLPFLLQEVTEKGLLSVYVTFSDKVTETKDTFNIY